MIAILPTPRIQVGDIRNNKYDNCRLKLIIKLIILSCICILRNSNA